MKQLYYREEGSISHPPLMILHGLWGASENWLRVSSGLSAQYHVIIPDLPNHGQSPHIAEHDYETLSGCIHKFITHLNLSEPLHIIGHSMGGKLLMHLLLKWPDLISKAIIIDIAPKDYRNCPEMKLHGRLANYMHTTPIGTISKRSMILRQIREHFPEEELYQLLAKNIRRNKEEGRFEWKININAIQENLETILSWHPAGDQTCPLPVLFIKGGNSGYMNETEDIPAIRQLFPAASLYTIPGANHAIHADHPQELTDCILKFLQNK